MFTIRPSLSDLLKSSFKSILKNKSRTFLTSLGVIIGVTSVILLVSIGNGLRSYITDQFESLGSNLLFISPGKLMTSSGRFNTESLPTVFFDNKDTAQLERKLKLKVNYVIPVSQALKMVKFSDNQEETYIMATTENYSTARNDKPSEGNGRWFTAEEDQKGSKVAVLGYQLAQDLFGNTNPIGRKITIEGKNLEVIGVMDKAGGGFGGGPSLDDYVFTPLETGFAIIGNDNIQSIQVSVKNKDDIDETKKEIKKIMLDRYEEDEFTVLDQANILSSINSILGAITAALTGIAAISLVVGGIGIMNIMLVTVTERTREIGLRKAIGAYPRAILIQFLFEAIILSGIGGIVGIILGILGTLLIDNFFPAQVTIQSILLAFGVSSAVGIIFGVAPARKASKLSPIEALRYE
ncbi:MAG: ABC transporter permease [Patescibacteria group bacterium]|jgi:putative ABC transport system permease protein